MYPFIVILPIIIGIIVILIVLSTKNLYEYPYEPDEKVLFTDRPKFFRSLYNPARPTWNYRAFVEVTNKRIIFYQLPVFGKKKIIRIVVDYTGKGDILTHSNIMGGFLYKKGYPELATKKELITFREHKGIPVLDIGIQAKEIKLLISKPRIEIHTNNIEQYKQLLK